MAVLRSRDNPRLRRWTRLGRDARLRRSEGCALIEGAHLVEAWLERHGPPRALIASEAGMARPEIAALVRRSTLAPVVLADRLFAAMADVETPAGVAAEIGIPAERPDPAGARLCVFVDAVQDAGNLGAILRSAAAFGVRDALLSRGCADAWSPKALRAGMGGQFLLRIATNADLEREIERFAGRTLCTVPRGGTPLRECDLSGRIGWLFGAEGQGVGARAVARASERVTIPMPGGTESLNVAAAAAICFYETARRGLDG